MHGMFSSATVFNQPLISWRTDNVKHIHQMYGNGMSYRLLRLDGIFIFFYSLAVGLRRVPLPLYSSRCILRQEVQARGAGSKMRRPSTSRSRTGTSTKPRHSMKCSLEPSHSISIPYFEACHSGRALGYAIAVVHGYTRVCRRLDRWNSAGKSTDEPVPAAGTSDEDKCPQPLTAVSTMANVITFVLDPTGADALHRIQQPQ